MKSLFKRKSLAVVSAFFVASIVTSCHDEEVANIEELSYRHAYERNFVKTFGEINPNQSWDFSSYARGKKTYVMTRAEGNNTFNVPLDADGYYHLQDEVKDWIFTEVCEEHGNGSNTKRVVKEEYWHAFSFEADPTDVFDMYPIYLGSSECAFTFNMKIVDNTQEPPVVLYDSDQANPDHGLWSIQDSNNGIEWASSEDGPWNTLVGSPGSGNHGSTVQAHYIRSKPFTIDFSDPKYNLTKPNTTVYFYIKILIGHSNLNEDGDVLTSITHTPNLVCIDCPLKIDAITTSEEYNTMFLGCETGNKEHTHNGRADFDYNDLMFLMIGRTPDIYYDEILQKVTIKKRYMIEDLYGFDYDFNDIVVDATDESTRYYIIDETDGEKKEQTGNVLNDGTIYPVLNQKATVKWLCGTLPFQIKIGSYTFGQVTDPTNTVEDVVEQLNRAATVFGGNVTPLGSGTGFAPEVTKTITGWNPDENNITAFIWTKAADGSAPDPSASSTYSQDGLWTGSEGIWVSTFPAEGDVPYIIAVDQNVDWMGELTHIPTTWLGGDMSSDNSTVVTVTPVNH